MTDPGRAAATQRRVALLLSWLLVAAGLLIGASPLLGIVSTADSSPTVAATAAGFVAVLPGVLALVLSGRRPVLGLAAAAGAGVVGVVRLLTDVAVLTEPDRITRPELFAETSDAARPFTAGAGGWLLVAADLLWLAVGVVAVVRVAPLVAMSAGPGPDVIFGDGGPEPGAAEPDPVAGSDGERDRAGDGQGVATAAVALSRREQRRRPLNLPMVLVGFAGAMLLMVGALGIPYAGGYLALRVLPFGSSLTGLVAAAVLGFLAAVVVVVAAALPRSIARAVLGGTALAAAVPSLTAAVAVLTGAPTGLSPVVWCGIAGAAILAAAGLLARGGPVRSTLEDPDGAPPARWFTVGTGVLAVLAAVALLGAWRLPLLYLDGAAPDGVAGDALAPAGSPHLVAAIPLGIAGAVALIRPVAELGRAAAAVVWAGAVFAFGQALWARSLVLATTGDSSTNPHSWTAGPGQWCSLVGTLLAVAAAVLAVITTRRAAQASPEIVDDASLDSSRRSRRWPAVALSVLILLALALPVHSDLTGAGPTLLHGYDLDTWGFWALAIGGVGAVWAAAVTRRPGPAAAWLVSAAAVVGQPLVVPAATAAVPGFTLTAGFWAGLLAVLVLLSATQYFAVLAARVRTVEQQPLDRALQGPRGRDGADAGPGLAARAESKGR
ncbi:MAG TPA: hypothetical protein VII33_18680 [Nakamurella sp.]